jgi:predicted O-linked N-acetylglucosamine transferase (SPINDLY family)
MEISRILNQIYKYYPKNASFSTQKYQKSNEYLKQLEKRKKAYENLEYKNCIENNLKTVFKDYMISDWTDLKNYNCYEYRILLYKNQSILDDDIELITVLNNERLDLFIFISILEKYYYIQFNKTEYKPKEKKWIFNILMKYPENLQKEIIELKRCLSLEGYIELKDKIVREKVDNIETDVKNIGDVRIFDCLFTDIIGV